MNYEKPNIALVASAVEAVKGSQIKDSTSFDGRGLVTPAAYQADE